MKPFEKIKYLLKAFKAESLGDPFRPLYQDNWNKFKGMLISYLILLIVMGIGLGYLPYVTNTDGTLNLGVWAKLFLAGFFLTALFIPNYLWRIIIIPPVFYKIKFPILWRLAWQEMRNKLTLEGISCAERINELRDKISALNPKYDAKKIAALRKKLMIEEQRLKILKDENTYLIETAFALNKLFKKFGLRYLVTCENTSRLLTNEQYHELLWVADNSPEPEKAAVLKGSGQKRVFAQVATAVEQPPIRGDGFPVQTVAKNGNDDPLSYMNEPWFKALLVTFMMAAIVGVVVNIALPLVIAFAGFGVVIFGIMAIKTLKRRSQQGLRNNWKPAIRLLFVIMLIVGVVTFIGLKRDGALPSFLSFLPNASSQATPTTASVNNSIHLPMKAVAVPSTPLETKLEVGQSGWDELGKALEAVNEANDLFRAAAFSMVNSADDVNYIKARGIIDQLAPYAQSMRQWRQEGMQIIVDGQPQEVDSFPDRIVSIYLEGNITEGDMAKLTSASAILLDIVKVQEDMANCLLEIQQHIESEEVDKDYSKIDLAFVNSRLDHFQELIAVFDQYRADWHATVAGNLLDVVSIYPLNEGTYSQLLKDALEPITVVIQVTATPPAEYEYTP